MPIQPDVSTVAAESPAVYLESGTCAGLGGYSIGLCFVAAGGWVSEIV